MPAPEPSGFIKTLNKMGYMTSTLDPYSREFVRFAPTAPGPALDIGAAYGIATLAALFAGARVIANDIDSRHLEILEQLCPPEHRSRLALAMGEFPERLNLSRNSIGCALICRVLHFFEGDRIELAANTLFQSIAPNGKVFVVAETPYLHDFQPFIPTYEARKRSGSLWPGLIEDVLALAPTRGKTLPARMNCLDPDVLTRVFTAAGFQIEKTAMFPRPDYPKNVQLDGRESVGMIAVKK